jgi:hypothetical protein
MAISESLEGFFKPETRKAGEDIFRKEAVFISSGSDTGIQAFVKVSGNVRVSFSSASISDSSFTAKCSCTAAAKDQSCKHMWAVLLATEEKYPDFLESKTEMNKVSSARADQSTQANSTSGAAQTASVQKPAFKYTPSPEAAAKNAERAQLLKERNALHRKVQYPKQKERAKEIKQAKKAQVGGSKSQPYKRTFPEHVQASLKFFAENGFAFEENLNEEDLSMARKKLSRIFHPDKGGSHDEALILNEHFSILDDYLHEQG